MLHQQLDDKTERIENLKQRLLESENRKVTIEVIIRLNFFKGAQKSQKIVTSFMDRPFEIAFLMIFKIQLLILKYLIFSLKVPAK